MTEQEYIDATDLKLLRAIFSMLKWVIAFEDPNKTRLLGVKENILLMIDGLDDKIDIDYLMRNC